MTSQLKRQVFETLLGEESLVAVYIDPRPAEVVLPSEHKNGPVLMLHFGLNLPVDIPMVVEDDGVVATLSFNRRAFRCEIPWTAVFAIVSGDDKRGRVFEEDVPKAVRAVQLRGFGSKEDGLVVVPAVSSSEPPKPLTVAEKRRTMPPGWGVHDGGKS